jgi:AcrR family transcriptional regulator
VSAARHDERDRARDEEGLRHAVTHAAPSRLTLRIVYYLRVEAGSKRPRGRPRDPAIDEAILGAARTLLVEVGYASLTMEAVASRAGVTKPTLYRRWPVKGALVWEAVFGKTKAAPMPDTGDVAGDLRVIVGWGVDEFTAPEARAALPGMVAEFESNPELRRMVRGGLIEPEFARVRKVLERAVVRGELRSDVDLELLMDVLVGTVFGRAVLLEHKLDDQLVDQLVDLVLAGARPPS